jgi:signal transduction histidine kinase
VARTRYRPTATTLLAAAVLGLLPVLAALQYRWLGQVSENERTRLQRALVNAMGAVARDIDAEVAGAVTSLNLDRLIADADAPVRNTAPRGAGPTGPAGLVRDILYVAPPDPGRTTLLVSRCDTRSASCAPTTWPAELAELQLRLARWYRRGSGDVGELSRIVRAPGVSQSVIVVPVQRGRSPRGRRESNGRGDRSERTAVSLLLLNDQWLRSALLPSIVARHFGAPRDSDFQIAVVHRDRPLDVVYGDHGPALDDILTRPEGWQEMFTLRPDGFSDRRSSDEGGISSGDTEINVFGRDEDDDDEEWMLVARHRDGSLQDAVANVRRRNMLVSSGILLLMGVSVGLIAVTARRAQRLAHQQIEFVAGVSHELRTPVAAIHLAAQNLADGKVGDPARIQRYGAAIQLESQRLRETVERVLQFASTSAGQGLGPRRLVDVRALVEEAAAAFRAEHAGTAVAVTAPAGTCHVAGDPAALRTCVQNVLSNAVKYGGTDPHVEITLTIESRARRPELRVSIKDSGPGIPAADLAHIYEPFFRGRYALEERIQGNGLGLYLVRRLITAHGGRVSAHSTLGKGSTFVLHLPLAPEASTLAAPAAAAAADPRTSM